MNTPLVITLFVMGLSGGLHCAAMCSGLVVASERAMQVQPLLPARKLLRRALQLQLSRVAGYALLGDRDERRFGVPANTPCLAPIQRYGRYGKGYFDLFEIRRSK